MSWKAPFEALQQKYQAELAILAAGALNPHAKLTSYDALLSACEGVDLKDSLDRFSKMLSRVDVAGGSRGVLQASFNLIFARHWAATKGTAFSYLVNPPTLANQFFFELFNLVQGRAPSAHEISLLAADEAMQLSGQKKEPAPLKYISRVLDYVVKRPHDLGDLLRYISLEEGEVVLKAISAHSTLPKFIQNADDFSAMLFCLDDGRLPAEKREKVYSEKRARVFEAFRPKLEDLIKTAQDFSSVICLLSPEERTVVYEAVKSTLPNLIKNNIDFSNVIGHLSPAQCGEVCFALGERLSSLVQTAEDFSRTVTHLFPGHALFSEKRAVVYGALKAYLPKLEGINKGFIGVIFQLSPEQCAEVCEAVRQCLPDFAKIDFSPVLTWLPLKQSAKVFSIFIKTRQDLVDILDHLPAQQSKRVCNLLQNKVFVLSLPESETKSVVSNYLVECRKPCF